jgi:hypothetical protein
MHKQLLKAVCLYLLATSAPTFAQNVGINETGALPAGSAMLDVSATNKGLLIPRLSRAQKFLIPAPANGLLIYQTDDTVGFWYYEQSKWVPLMRSLTFGPGLTGGFIQGKGTADLKKTGVIAGTYGKANEFPIVSINDYGQVTLVATQTITDNDTTNELQSLLLKNDTLYLSKNNSFVPLKSFWNTTGNSGLSATNNFLGTTDNIPLRFRANNIWIGELNSINNNISFGARTNANSSGSANIAIGRNVMNANNGGIHNTAVGTQAMFANNSGSYNTAVGYNTLYSNATGGYNVALGYEAVGSNTSGYYNVGTGYRALYSNTNGNYNIGIGMYAMLYNIGGSLNAGVGYYTLGANNYGNYNTGYGSYCLPSNSTGYGNSFVGYASAYYNSTGYYNSGLGYYAGYQTTTGYYNTSLGFMAGPNNGALNNTTALGNGANTTANNQIRVGNASVTSIGGFVGWTNLSDGRYKTQIKEDIQGLPFIMKLRPVSYLLDIRKFNQTHNLHDSVNWKEKYEGEFMRHTGFIAQEVEKAAKELGFDFSGVDAPKNERDDYGLRYAEFVVPMVKAIQEQQAQIEALKKQQQELMELNKKLLEALEKTNNK